MIQSTLQSAKVWLKQSDSQVAATLFKTIKAIMVMDLWLPHWLNRIIYMSYTTVRNAFNFGLRVFLQTPAFKGRCVSCGKAPYLYGGLPFVTGPLSISVGDNCRISGQTTFSASSHTSNPELVIGNNVGIGWQTTIAVGRKVIIEDNVRIAGRANLFGYSGHPLDPARRAKGEADDFEQTGDIHLKKDSWLATNVIVKSGVTIGQGSIIAAGSVVTKDIPDFVIAAGNPARVIRPLSDKE